MTTIIQRYLTKQLLFAALVSIIALIVPVIILSLFSHLPKAAVFSNLIWPALYGILPMIFYICLPVVVGIAITWSYGHFSSEGTLTILHMTGLSVLSVRMPAMFVAVAATVLSYVLSCVVAPMGASYLHDVLYVIRHDLSPALLEPNRLYSMNDGRRAVQFQERVNNNKIAGVILREITDDNEEYTFFARDAIFERREQESWLVMNDGLMLVKNADNVELRTIVFDQMIRPTGLAGRKLPKRAWTATLELGALDFLAAWSTIKNSPVEKRRWAGEAVKRFGIPPLAIAHSMLGLALTAMWGGTGRGRRGVVELVCVMILLIHILIVVTAEYTRLQDIRLAWVVIAMILAEFTIASALIVHQLRRRASQYPREQRSMRSIR